MKTNSFVHLHTHSAYSLLDGACRIDDMVARALELEQPALALTDHGVMYGLVDFYKACTKAGVKPILGCEAYIVPTSTRQDRETKQPNHHLVLLAETDEGYRNLSYIISQAHIDGFYYRPRIDKELLARHSKGLIGLSACLNGEVNHHLSNSNLDAAEESAAYYSEAFGKGNFFLEIQDHGIPEQRRAAANARKLSERMGLPLVATNDVHYLKHEHAKAHEILLAMQTGTVLSDPKRFRYTSDQFYMKSRAEMEAVFPEMPQALDLTLEIAERCNAKIDIGQLHFPIFELPPEFDDPKVYLEEIAGRGLQRLYNIADRRDPKTPEERKIVERFNYELDIIDRTGFTNYFLVVQDFVDFAHRSKIRVGPGRGSGGGSIVAYTLGIIGIDPIRYNLIFERFLNPERVSPPDFDIDFCRNRRGEVIDYVKRKYGEDHVAQIITFSSLGAKNVIQDVGRVLEIPFRKCMEFTKLVPDTPGTTLESARKENPDFDRLCGSDPDLQTIMQHAEVLEGLFRNPGTHAAGVVIGDRPLIDMVPLSKDKKGQFITQFAKEPVEDVGLLKMDFLGLRNLTVLDEAIELVKELHGVEIDLETLDITDSKTYELLTSAETTGVFQLESAGMQRLIREVGIGSIEDLVAVIALFRPGPMKLLPDYIARKKGETPVVYDHPLLEPILKETYGVMVYQEQVQKAATELAGYSLGQSDILRRAMGKKKAEVMDEEREHFIEGCKRTNNIDEELAGRIFHNIASFAGYGFNKAHSVGYGIVSFQTAYMKANWPAEFMSALISLEMGNFDKMPTFITEANRMGLSVLPPDVNRSQTRFVPEKDGIRYGLAGIKAVGAGAAQAIVDARKEGGPFTSFDDLVTRVDNTRLNKRALESLVSSGALDSMGLHRARLFNAIEQVVSRTAARRRDLASGQTSLFDLLDDGASHGGHDEQIPDCPAWPILQVLTAERELLGVYFSGHPLDKYRHFTDRFNSIADAEEAIRKEPASNGRKDIRLYGLVSAVDKRFDRQKRPWAILSLEDEFSRTMEVRMYSEAFERYGESVAANTPMVFCGELQNNEGVPSLAAEEAYILDEALAKFSGQLTVAVDEAEVTEAALGKLADNLAQFPGKTKVLLKIKTAVGKTVTQELPDKFSIEVDEALFKSIGECGLDTAVSVTFAPDVYLDEASSRPRRNFARRS